MDLDESVLARVFWVALAVTAVLAVVMTRAGRGMRSSGGPGIVPFELAESEREVARMLRAWGDRGKAAARRSLKLDMLFLLAYGTALASASLYISARADREDVDWLVWVAAIAAGMAVLAAALDVVENLALLRHLDDRISARSITVARGAAQAKFGLCGVVALVVFVGFSVVQLAP